MKMKSKNNKGITLIALVITIIVLLILAGVSIAMLTGQNGILTQAARAKEETENAAANEANILSNYEDAIYEAIGDVPQVNDSNPGVLEGSGTEQEPFVINSIEDLVVFADNVTKGTNTYQDQYVELGLSLDFNSDKSYVNPDSENYAQYGYNGKLKEVLNTSGFIPIGTMEATSEGGNEEKSFCGDFNGKSFSIYNLKIIQDKKLEGDNNLFVAFFANNSGNIKKLFIRNATININTECELYPESAILVGENTKTGIIQNCLTTGNIEVTNKAPMGMVSGMNVAGIVGANKGIIEECYNGANIKINYSSKDNRVAGIAGANSRTGSIENVYNTGDIFSEALVSQEDNACNIGGIVGVQVGKLENGYSSGKVSSENNEDSLVRIGGVLGLDNNTTSVTNNYYYLENTVNPPETNVNISNVGEAKSSIQMKSQEFLNLLNRDNSGMWKFSSAKNQGYPVLYWE